MKRLLFAASLFFTLLSVGTAGAEDPGTASDFTLPSSDGGSVSLRDFLHKKVIVMNFWAAWCDACEEEMPELLDLKSRYASKEVVFLGINAGDTEKAAKKFADKMNYSYQILLDRDKSVSRKFQVFGIPQTLVIAKDGKIIYREGRPPKDLRFIKDLAP